MSVHEMTFNDMPIIVTHDELGAEIIQGDPNWLALREGRPTASCFNRILTPAKLQRAKDSYLNELVAQRLGAQSDSFESEDMANGKAWEARARAQYVLETGNDVREVAFVFEDERERCGASPDGLVGDDGGVEIKSPKAETHIGYLLADVLPRDYVGQVYGSLWITQRHWWDFWSYSNNLPNFCVRINADDLHYQDWVFAWEPVLEDFLGDLEEAHKKVESLNGEK